MQSFSPAVYQHIMSVGIKGPILYPSSDIYLFSSQTPVEQSGTTNYLTKKLFLETAYLAL